MSTSTETPKKSNVVRNIGIVLAIGLVLGCCGLFAFTSIWLSNPANLASLTGAAPQAPTKESVSVERQTVVEPAAAPEVAAPQVYTKVELIGTAETILPGRYLPNADLVLTNTTGITAVVVVSSDPLLPGGTIERNGAIDATLDSNKLTKGYVGAFVIANGDTLTMGPTGWNSANGYQNVWAEMYVVPEGMDPDKVAQGLMDELQNREKKLQTVLLNAAGTFDIQARQP